MAYRGRIFFLSALVVSMGTASALEFRFSVSVEGAGTKKVKREQLADGKPLIFPEDEFDLVEGLKPAIEQFRTDRKEKAKLEAVGIYRSIEGASAQVGMMVKEALGSEKLSDGFQEHYQGEMETVKQILYLWVVYSQDVSRVKFWNQAMRHEIRDPVSKVEAYSAYKFSSKPGALNLSIEPEIFQKERGMGFIDFNRSIRHDPAMRLDIPIVGRPGTSLEVLTKDAKKFLQVTGTLLAQYPNRVLVNDLRLYLTESMLRHEIKTRWFHESMPEECPNALARYALAQLVGRSADATRRRENFRKLTLISPATPDLARLARDLDELKWNEPPAADVSAEVRRAYSNFLMGAMLLSPEKEESRKKLFSQSREEKFATPASYFTYLEEEFPKIEAGFSSARTWQLEELKKKIAPGEGQKKAATKNPRPPVSPPPSRYKLSRFDGITIQHPDFLTEAVSQVGPAWGKRIRENRERFHRAVAKRPWIEKQILTDKELDRFKTFGLSRPSRKAADQWAEVLAKLAEADRLFSALFTDEIHIWMKEDIQKILREGGNLRGFSMGIRENTVAFAVSFDHILEGLSFDQMKEPGVIESLKPIMLPIILKRELVDGASREELVKLLEDDGLISSIRADELSAENLSRLMGMPLLGMTEEFCFLILVHELAETAITERVVASADRRWFTDGMATYIAAEMAGDRFGNEEAGWNELERIYRVDPKSEEAIMSQLQLFKWRASEDRDGDSGPTELSNARYLYSAKAIRRVVDPQPDGFVRRWIEEISKTRWNRTSSQTVIESYDRLTGGNLRQLVDSVGSTTFRK